MDLLNVAKAELLKDVPECKDARITCSTVQSLLWPDIVEQRVYLDDKRVFSRLIDDGSAWSTPFTEVKEASK